MKLFYIVLASENHVVRPASSINVVRGNLFLNDEHGDLISLFPKGGWLEVTTVSLTPENAQ
jgi:hypothetical protein